jgi:tRNA dimethylallyltransferase
MTGTGFKATLPVDGPALVPHLSCGLDLDRSLLDARIAARVEWMFAAGLVAEVRGLLGVGLREGRTASRALGYAQVVDLLDGRVDLAAAKESTIGATRAYARRQQRWFRRDPRTRWLPADEQPSSTASSIAALLTAEGRTLTP